MLTFRAGDFSGSSILVSLSQSQDMTADSQRSTHTHTTIFENEDLNELDKIHYSQHASNSQCKNPTSARFEH